MRLTLSLAKLYTDLDLSNKPIDELIDRIGSQLGAVEEVLNLGEQYRDVVIARVVSCENHPNADRLHVCKLDDGGKVENVTRDEQGYVQVVCGAPNVREGLLVAWLPPGATVPSTFHTEPFVLDARELRGVMSNGMLASAKELGVSDEHSGILEIEEDAEIAPGTRFADFYHLDDHVIDIENKMFTHRPDCFGVLGIYREIAGIYGEEFKSPHWYGEGFTYPLQAEQQSLPLTVHNDLPELVPRFMVIPMTGVMVKPSPVWLQIHLMRAGIRPINNIVDITNFLMYLTGQPMHAYDYDKVRALGGSNEASITIRHPKPGEKIKLLNGKEIEPRNEAIMIATGDHLIGVGGVMGGSETEVDDKTTNIILECATFDMYSIRRTSMSHGLFTDAVTRFNKGQSPLQNGRILAKAAHEVTQLAEGKLAGNAIDDKHISEDERVVHVTSDFINKRLGLTLSPHDMQRLLQNVEFRVGEDEGELSVVVPFWRTDIEVPEDVVEEVGRLYGYDHLPKDLPRRDLTPAAKNADIQVRQRIADVLSRAGANEVLTYTFVHGDLISKVGQDRELAFGLSNALSPDLQYYRLSLTPSLLDLVYPNSRAGYGHFALFEMNKVHGKSEVDEDGLPREFARIALVVTADDKAARQLAGAPYYLAQTYLRTLVAAFGFEQELSYKPLSEVDYEGHQLFEQMCRPFEPKRAAVVYHDERLVGIVGEYRRDVTQALKLPAFTAGFEVFGSAFDVDARVKYTQLPRFPKVEQDISLKVPATVTYGQLFDCIQTQVESLKPEQTVATLSPLDLYQRQDDPEHKQIALRLTIASYERTLKAEEVNALLNQAAQAANEQLGAERI